MVFWYWEKEVTVLRQRLIGTRVSRSGAWGCKDVGCSGRSNRWPSLGGGISGR